MREFKKSPIKILLCNNLENYKLIETYLQEEEFVLLQIDEKEEIQEALDGKSINLILMDILIPEKLGMEWLREIIKKKMVPVVMITESNNEEAVVQFLKDGAVDYISRDALTKKGLLEIIRKAIEEWKELQQREANLEELEQMVYFDPLTGVKSKYASFQKLEEEVRRVKRYKRELALIVLDIDHLKKINDEHGYLTGDKIIRKVATLIRDNAREVDFIGRIGGEEFIIISPDTTLSSALKIAERIRKCIEESEIKDSKGNILKITVSQGVVGYEPDEDQQSFISRADKVLHKAKEEGRNRMET